MRVVILVMKSKELSMKLLTNQDGIKGRLEVPGDKSISHRSIMFGAMAKGTTTIRKFLRADDCLATKAMFEQLGVKIEDNGEVITVYGKGVEGLRATASPIDIGNSGTTIRLTTGILAGSSFTTTLFGDESIAKRPMNRVMLPLREMGAHCEGSDNSQFPPITITGTHDLRGITYKMPVASAQVKSAILLAALQAKGETVIEEKEVTRDHTEDMIRQFGGSIEVKGKVIRLSGEQELTGQDVTVPGDISSAAFFLVAASLLKNSQLELVNVGLNQTRTGIIDVLKEMGAKVTVNEDDPANKSGSIIAETSQLKGIDIGGDIIPRLIDELPVIALLATQASGRTVIRDAEELKVKETNRIDATARELTKMGAKIEATADGLIIDGPTALHGAEVTSYGDHRIGMMLTIAALLVDSGEVVLEKSEAVSVSYPNFFNDLAKLLER